MLRNLLAPAGGGFGFAVWVAHAQLPPGHGFGSVFRVASTTFASPGFWASAGILFVLFESLRRAAGKLFAGQTEQHPQGFARVIQPLMWGAALPAAALLVDAFSFWCSAAPLAALGLGLGALTAGRRLVGARLGAGSEDDPWRLWLAIAAVGVPLALVGSWSTAAGDEPHYLIVAHSILEDGDLDVADDYRDRVYAPYHPTTLLPHYKVGLEPGARYSMHGVGLPVLLLPAYAAGRLLGGWAMILLPRVFLMLFYGIFAWLLYGLIDGCGGRSAARRGTAAVVLLAPLMFAPLHVFSEVPAMTLALFAFLALRREASTRARVFAAAALAVLPWIGVKYIPLAASVALVAVAGSEPAARPRRAALVGAGLMAGLVPHALYTWVLYGSLSPAAVYLGSNAAAGEPALGADWVAYLAAWPGAVATAIGYVLDQKEGLLAYGPHFLLASAGLAWMWRTRRADVVALTVVAASFVGPYALSQQLGGHGPPVRPLMPILWTLAPALGVALAFRAPPRWYAVGRGGLLALAAALTTTYAAQPHLLPHDYPVKMSRLVQHYTPYGSAAWRWFPQWVNVATPNWPVTLAWTAVIAAVAVGLWKVGASAVPATEEDSSRITDPDATDWGIARATLATLGLLVLVHHATVVRTDLHRPTVLDAGPVVWIVEELPKRAWGEAAGVWATRGRPVDFVMTTGAPLDTLDVTLSVLVDAEVAVWVQGTGLSGGAAPRAGRVARLQIGRGRRDGDRFAYQCRLWSSRGVAPAALRGSADERFLGVFWRLSEVRNDARRP